MSPHRPQRPWLAAQMAFVYTARGLILWDWGEVPALALGPNHGLERFLHSPRCPRAALGGFLPVGTSPGLGGEFGPCRNPPVLKATVPGSSPHAAEWNPRVGGGASEHERVPVRGCAGLSRLPHSCWQIPARSCFVPHNLFALNSRCKVKQSQKKYLG